MNSSHIAIAASLVLFTATATGQEKVGLKGYFLGDDLAECPAGSAASKGTLPGTQDCKLQNVQTIAAQKVSDFVVTIGEGKVVSVGATIDGGSSAASAVRDALAEVYGRPSESKSHVDEYTWRVSGSRVIKVDGNRYSNQTFVFVMDMEPLRRLKKQEAEKNKKDL